MYETENQTVLDELLDEIRAAVHREHGTLPADQWCTELASTFAAAIGAWLSDKGAQGPRLSAAIRRHLLVEMQAGLLA
jgi:hypothetical protein